MEQLQTEEIAGPSNSATDRSKEETIRRNESIASGPEHTASGIKTSLHGTIYQIKLLMLFLNRGMKHGYKFLLATEVDEADKFDDLVFSYDNHNQNGKVYRFLQAKHKQDSSKKIRFYDLLKENKDDSPNERKTKEKSNDDFSLLKYFVSYRKIKHSEMFKGELKDFILCTNIDLDDEVLKADGENEVPAVEINNTEDNILDFNNFPKSKRYKFSKGTSFYTKLQSVFKNTHCEKLAANLAKIVLNKEKTLPKDEMFKCYRGWLLEKVFKIETDNNGRFIKFRDDILQDSCDGDEALNNFRKLFILYIKKGKSKEKIHDIVDKIKFKIPDTFTLDTKGALSLDVTSGEIDDFLDKLVLAVNQPNDMELQYIITDEIGKEMNFVNGEFIASKLLETILDWVKDRKGRFLRFEDSEQLFKCLKQNLARLGLVGVTLAFKSKIDNGYYFKDNVKVIESLRKFLKDEMKQVLIIYHKNKLLSSMKITQANTNAKVDSDLFFDIKTLQSLVGTATCPLDALRSEAYNYLVVDDITELNKAGEVLKRIIEILKQDRSKRIILNIAYKSKKNANNLLRLLFKELEFNDNKCLILEDNDNGFCSLNLESQKKLCNQSKVIFQGKKFGLSTVINENKDLVHGQILSELILNGKIEIGKPFIDYKYEKVKDYFVERTLQRYVFFIDSLANSGHDFYITSNSQINESELDFTEDIVLISDDESEFKKLCERYKSRNIHWFIQNVVTTKYINSHNSCRDSLDLVISELEFCGYKDLNNTLSHIIPQKIVSNRQLHKLSRVVVLFHDVDLAMDRGYNDKFIERLKQCNNLFLQNANGTPSETDDFEHADTKIDKTDLITCLPISQVTNTNLKPYEIIILVSIEDSDLNMLLEHYGDKIIHHMYQSRLLYCRQSQGKISKVRQYCNEEYKCKPETVMALPEKLVIIAAAPGMGKSVLLTHLAKQELARENNAILWFVKVDLITHLKEFAKLHADNEKDVLKFLCRAVKPECLRDIYGGKHEMHKFVSFESMDAISLNVDEAISLIEADFLEMQLLIRIYNSGNMVLLLDGFDEISPRFSNVVLDLIDTLKRTRLYKIWLTTRPYNIQFELENRFGIFAYKLAPLRTKDQIKMFTKFWTTRLVTATNEACVAYYVRKFLNLVSQHIVLNEDNKRNFISIPLHIEMIAITYEHEFIQFYNSNDYKKNFSKLVQNFNLFSLYDKFLSIKLSFIYKNFEETDLTHYYVMEEHQLVTLENHRYLALLELFKSKDLESFLSKETMHRVSSLTNSIREAKEKTGLILRVNKGKPQFVHRTYAEYFAADLLACMVDPNDKRYSCCRTSAVNFLYKIWLRNDAKYQPLINFLNYKLLTKAGNKSDIDELTAVMNGDCSVLKNKEKKLIRDSFGRTLLHLACCLHKWKQCLTFFKRNKSDLLIQDTLFKWSPLHYAVASIGTKILNENDDFNIDILRDVIDLQDMNGKTPFMLAFELNYESMITYLLKATPDLNIVDKSGHTVLHYINETEEFFDLIEKGASPYVGKDKEGNSLFDKFFKDRKWVLVYRIIKDSLSSNREHHSHAIKYLIQEMHNNSKFIILTCDEFDNDTISYLCKIIDIDTINTDGKSALHAAVLDVGYNCIMGNLDKVILLLNKNININMQDNTGKTALHYAIEFKHDLYELRFPNDGKYDRELREYETSLDIIECLLNNGADVNIRDNERKTALNYVADCFTKLNNILNDYGADTYIFSERCDFTIRLLDFFNTRFSSKNIPIRHY